VEIKLSLQYKNEDFLMKWMHIRLKLKDYKEKKTERNVGTKGEREKSINIETFQTLRHF
jgi:hypothetical protein